MSPGTWRMFGLLGLGALALGAQEMPPALPGTTFGTSVDVRLVNVEVVVTDAKGERARGLSAADLKLEVDGREVPIEYFSEIADGRSMPAAAPSPPSQTAEGSSPIASPAPQGRSLLVFIDDVFAAAQWRDTVLKTIEKDLRLLGPEDRMAIVAFGDVTTGGRLEVLSGWTGDRAALAAALQAARRRPASGNDVLASRRSVAGEEVLRGAADSSDIYAEDKAYTGDWGAGSIVPTVPGDLRLGSWLGKVSRAAVAAMNAMAPSSGRRTLLLLSGGWTDPHAHISVAITANRLGYTIYPVDVPGIDTMLASNDASLPVPRSGTLISTGWEGAAERGMEFLARVTGGKAVLNSARLNTFERVMEDTSSYYWLGFTPPWNGDDRHHRVTVEARRQGLTVRSRQGFSDLSRGTRATLAMQGLLLLGGDPKDKRLIVEAVPRAGRGGAFDVPVTVSIPVSELTPVQEGDHWIVSATLTLGVVDATGSFSDLAEMPLRMTLPAKPDPGALARHRMTLKLRRTRQRLVFTARDPLGGPTLWGEAEIRP